MHSHALLLAGLALALLGSPLVLIAARILGQDTFAFGSRLALWVIAAAAVFLAVRTGPAGFERLGLHALSFSTFALGIVAGLLLCALFPVIWFVQKALGLSYGDETGYARIRELSFRSRVFVLITAVIVEEVLYRGYAIGIGQHLVGGVWFAAAISLLAFTLAHYKWKASHLPAVFVAGAVLTLLFVLTHNLLACIFAHAIVDGVGFLLIPEILKRRAQVHA